MTVNMTPWMVAAGGTVTLNSLRVSSSEISPGAKLWVSANVPSWTKAEEGLVQVTLAARPTATVGARGPTVWVGFVQVVGAETALVAAERALAEAPGPALAVSKTRKVEEASMLRAV